MTERWFERISRWFGRQSQRGAPVEAPVRDAATETIGRSAPIEIIIGIDYGTRFTKVAIGREGQEATVWAGFGGEALIPSIVYVTNEGDVLPWPDEPPRGAIQVEYLKMLLAKPHDSVFDLPLRILAGQTRENIIRALAALFLSEVIRRVTKSEQDKPYLRNAIPRWLVNVGVPVEHFDTEDAGVRDVFQEVTSVALHWSESPPTDFKVTTLVRSYQGQAATIDRGTTRASVFPELAAALLTAYIRDPNRPEGLYGFCDIGGGTIDGAIFRLNRSSSLPPLAILSASVAPHGTAAVARAMVGKFDRSLPRDKASTLTSQIDALLAGKRELLAISPDLAARILEKYDAEARTNVQNFVRKFVNCARLKRSVDGYTFADPFTREKIELRFFLAGGGAESGWYKTAILSLDPEKNPAFDGVKKLRLETVKRPTGFRGSDFSRFVIALGLTNMPDEIEKASQLLPSRINKKPPPPEREGPRPITKDDV